MRITEDERAEQFTYQDGVQEQARAEFASEFEQAPHVHAYEMATVGYVCSCGDAISGADLLVHQATDAQKATIARLSDAHGRPGAGALAPAWFDRREHPAIEGWFAHIFYHIEPEGDAHS